MMDSNVTIREGRQEDIPAIWQLVRELAVYEKAPLEHTLTEEMMLADGFGSQPLFGFYVAEYKGLVVGMALYYYRYSTWKGKSLYLEDFYVKEDYRKLKIGYELFKTIIRHAKSNHCKRISWQVLEWNQLAIDFYKRFDASLDPEWVNGALTEAQILSFES